MSFASISINFVKLLNKQRKLEKNLKQEDDFQTQLKIVQRTCDTANWQYINKTVLLNKD